MHGSTDEIVEHPEEKTKMYHPLSLQPQLSSDRLRSIEKSDNKPRLLLVSDHLPHYNVLVSAVKDSTTCCVVRYVDWDLDDLVENLKVFAGEPAKQFASVGLLDHGTYGSFNLLEKVTEDGVHLRDVKENRALQDIFKFLAGYVQAPKDLGRWRQDLHSRIDLMACCVAGSNEGLELIKYLEDLTHVNWAASIDKTGNEGDGMNWDMETEAGLGPVNECYFRSEPLKEWHDCAFWQEALAPLAPLGEVFDKGVGAVKQVADDVGTTVDHVAKIVAGRTSIKVHNDYRLPILVAFSHAGGYDIQGPFHVDPGQDSSWSHAVPGGILKAVWVSFTGKTWHYQTHMAQQEGWNREASWVWKDGQSQTFIGFDASNLLSEVMQAVQHTIEKLGDGIRKTTMDLFGRELEKFKEILKKANLSDLLKFEKSPPTPTALKDYSRSKKQKLGKKHNPSTDGKTVFESFWDEGADEKRDPSGALHADVHKLRDNMEAIRYVLMDAHDSFDDMQEVLKTPKQLREDCQSLRLSIKSTKKCMKQVNISASGPVGSIASAVKHGIEVGMDGICKSISKTEDKLEKIETKYKLAEKCEMLKKNQASMKKTVPFEKIEEFNFVLAQVEQETKSLSDKWPKASGKLPEASAKQFENTLSSIAQPIQKSCRQIETCAERSRTISKVFGIANYVVVQKNAIRETYEPVTKFFNQLEKALKTIWEKVLKPILELPIVKDILEFLGTLADTLIDKILEFTQLDKLADWIGEKMNPFTALHDIKQQMEQTCADCLEACSSGDDAVTAVRGLEGLLKTLRIPVIPRK